MIFLELVRNLVEDPRLFLEIMPSLNEDRFSDPFERALLREVNKFYRLYRKTPNADELRIVFTQHHPTLLKRFNQFNSLFNPANKLNASFLKEELLKSVRAAGLEKIIVDTAKTLSATRHGVNYESLWGQVKDLVLSTQENRLGLAAHSDIELILNRIHRAGTFNRIGLNQWRLFDALLGGIGRQELMLYMAPSGSGKTSFLCNVAVLAMLGLEKNVLCITTELTDTVFTARLYRRILSMSREKFRETSQSEKLRGIRKFAHLTKSKFHVVYHKPGTATALDILSAVEQFENVYGEEVDVVILDYLDKLKVPRGELYRLALQDTTEELRSVALEKNLALVTATQTNRESMKKGETTGYHTSEGIGKHQSSDVVITMQQTEEERVHGFFKLRFDKVREISIPQAQLLYMQIDPENFVMKEDEKRTLALWNDYGFKNYNIGKAVEE